MSTFKRILFAASLALGTSSQASAQAIQPNLDPQRPAIVDDILDGKIGRAHV